jgi:hypothetical protein
MGEFRVFCVECNVMWAVLGEVRRSDGETEPTCG